MPFDLPQHLHGPARQRVRPETSVPSFPGERKRKAKPRPADTTGLDRDQPTDRERHALTA
jgi:hypothetical protein